MTPVTSISMYDARVQDTLEAHVIIQKQTLCFIKSMSLKCAVELHIPDAIHRHGKPTTIHDLLHSLSIPKAKSQSLRILMHILSQEGIFKFHINQSGEETFDLTPMSHILLTSSNYNRTIDDSPFIHFILDHHVIESFHQLSHWFNRPNIATTPFEMAHKKTFWDLTRELPKFNDLFNKGMASDSSFVANVLTKDKEVFRGIGTLVDVGGGTGLMVAALVEAFPGLKCIVFDLPHVIGTTKKIDGIQFVAGDMFAKVPPADVVLLKWILHDWNDDDCIKILRRCKEAIPHKERGGKVIIIDIVVGVGFNTQALLETQLLFDLLMTTLVMGKERDEGEWHNLFIAAGFSGYKIISSIDLRSIIEVYP